MKSKHVIYALIPVLILGLSACSAKKTPEKRVPFKSEPDYQWGDLKPVENFKLPETSATETGACKFLNDKRVDLEKLPTKRVGTFQLYSSIYTGQFNQPYGAHAIAKLPQILFMLSKEGSEDGAPMYRSYDTWSFYKLAKKEYHDKVPDYCDRLNLRDDAAEKRYQNKLERDQLNADINDLQTQQKNARANNDADAFRWTSAQITKKRIYRDSLSAESSRLDTQIENYDLQLKQAAKSVKQAANAEQLEALDNLEALQTAINNWDGYNFGYAKQQFTNRRNAEIEKKINTRIPGALDGTPKTITESDLFKMYLRYLEILFPGDNNRTITKYVTENMDVLRPLMTAELSLFNNDTSALSWIEVEKDVANEVKLLSERPRDIQDATCKFIISQRLMAQIVSIKGVTQSPVLTADGLLPRLEKDPAHLISHADIPGIYKLVVDETWIKRIFYSPGQEIPLPQGIIDPATNTVKPEEYFSWVRLLSHIASSANEAFWVQDKKNPVAGEIIPGELLKLSFGMMAISMNALEAHFIVAHQREGFIEIKPKDSASRFAALVNMTVDALNSFDAIYKMHQEIPNLSFLDNEKLTSISEKGDKKNQLNKLLYCAIKGAFYFYRLPATTEADKEALRTAIKRAGVYLNNEALYHFDDKP